MAKLQAETLTDKEMDLWSELITSFSSEHLGRAHEMLFSAIVEIRAHRAMVKRLEEWAGTAGRRSTRRGVPIRRPVHQYRHWRARRRRTPQPHERSVNVDTSNERLEELSQFVDGSHDITADDTVDLIAALRELQQLRAAKAADRERVVSEVVHQFYLAMRTVQHGMTGAEKSVAAAAIATRVADALAVPGRPTLTEQQESDITNAISDLERGSRGRMPYDLTVRDALFDLLVPPDNKLIPPLVREIIQREFERVPADPKYDWERQRLAECLEALP